MGDIPHRAWFHFVAEFLPHSAKPLADLFSGPGYMAAAARAAGRVAVAIDRHLPFMRKAQGICGDAVALPFADGVFSALTASNAALNYLTDTTALGRHFEECCRVLESGGVYVFDICPPERAALLAGRTFGALGGKVRFAHRYASATRTLTTTVRIHNGEEISEEHVQKIFEPAEIAAAAASAGFAVLRAVPNYGLPAAGENVPVMTYVLCKRAAATPKV